MQSISPTYILAIIILLIILSPSKAIAQHEKYMTEKLEEIEILEAKRNAIVKTNQRYSEEHIQLYKEQFSPLNDWLGYNLGLEPSQEKMAKVIDFIDEIERTRLEVINLRGKSDPIYGKWVKLLYGAYGCTPFLKFQEMGRKPASHYSNKILEEMYVMNAFEEVKKEEYKSNGRVANIVLSIIDPINFRGEIYWQELGIERHSSSGNPFANEVKKRFGETQEDQMVEGFTNLIHNVYPDSEPQAAILFNGLIQRLIRYADEQLERAIKSEEAFQKNKPVLEFDSALYVKKTVDDFVKSYEKTGVPVSPQLLQMFTAQAQGMAMSASYTSKTIQSGLQKSQNALQEVVFSSEIFESYRYELSQISGKSKKLSDKRKDFINATITLYNEQRIGKYQPKTVASRLKYKPKKLLAFIEKQLE